MSKKDDVIQDDQQDVSLEEKIEELEAALRAAKDAQTKAEDGEHRALADYQNVVRRSQEDKLRMAKLAARDMVNAILLPLDHLNLAKEQLKDAGLNMVHQQFIQALLSQGVQEVDALGQPFNEHKMEVIDKRPVSDKVQDNVVIAVTQRGYTMNGEVIRHAKVVIGVFSDKKEENSHNTEQKK
jgi:molecular chaperone GrpE